MQDIVFWGGTGHARVLHEALAGTEVRLVAIFDNRDIPSPLPGVALFVGRPRFADWLATRRSEGKGDARFAIAIGGGRGHDRIEIHDWLLGNGLAPMTIVHPRAWVAADASIGAAGQVLAGALLASHARLDRDVILNTGASVDHDCMIGRGVHVGPGAVLAGEVVVEEFSFIGAGATVLPRVRIGAGAVVGAGSVVTRDVPPNTVVAGNPARPLRAVV